MPYTTKKIPGQMPDIYQKFHLFYKFLIISLFFNLPLNTLGNTSTTNLTNDDSDNIVAKLTVARTVYAKREQKDSLFSIMDSMHSKKKISDSRFLVWKIRMQYSVSPPDSLATWVKEARTKADTVTDPEITALLNLVDGMVLFRENKLLGAYKQLRNALILFKSEKDIINEAYAASYIGMIFERIGELELARKYIELAISLFKSMNADYPSTQLAINLSNVVSKDDSIMARHILQKTIETARKVKDSSLEFNAAISLWSLAGAENDSAIENGMKIVDIAKNIGEAEYIASAYINLAEALLIRGDKEKAKRFLSEAKSMAEKNRYLWLRYNALPPLIKIYEEKNFFDSAYLLQKEFIGISDTLGLSLGKNRHSASAIEMGHAIKDYDKRLKIESQRRKFRDIIIVLSILATIITISLTFLIIIQIKKRVKAEQEFEKLKHKELINRNKQLKLERDAQARELTAHAISLDEKDKILHDIMENRNIYTIDDIINKLKKHILEDRQREKYQEIFEKTNPMFFQKLRDRAPSLSENELRHCSLIAMGLGIKQISVLLEITQESVQKARYRLRKKLNLKEGETLENLMRTLHTPADDEI